jgi:signal peptidase
MNSRTRCCPQPQLLRIAPALPARSRREPQTRTIIAGLLLTVAVLVTATSSAGMALGLLRFTAVDSGSMRPAFTPGDVAILTPEQPAAVRVGQIVAFHPPGQPHITVIHRVVTASFHGGTMTITTRGDANNSNDPWRARLLGTVWHSAIDVPKIGYLVVAAGQRPVRLAILAVVILFTLLLVLEWVWREPDARRELSVTP